MIKEKINNFVQKISQINQRFGLSQKPRMKLFGIFIAIIGFVGEIIFRKISHFLANGLLFFLGEDLSGAGNIVDKWFTTSAPIVLVYIPAIIALWLILRDGIKKLDWVFVPILIGILIKGGIYGIVSLSYKTSEFWELTRQGIPSFFLWLLIIMLMISGLVGLIKWFIEILR